MSPESAANLLKTECFLFDLDGTLVDSNPCHERAYLEALSDRLPEVAARFVYEHCKGRPTREAIRLYGVDQPALIEELTEAKQAAYRRLVEAGAVQLLPHAHALLSLLRERGKRLFLVTGASARSTRAVLTSLAIHDWFDRIVTADDVSAGKPAPDCWLVCCERASIPRDTAIVLEDALSGVESARAAGLACLAVNNPELAALPEYAGTLEDVLLALRA